MQRITPFLWFDSQAEEAANFYVSVFKNSKVKQITHYAGEDFPEKRGQVMTVSFELNGQEFTALNGGPLQVHRSCLVRDQLRDAGGDRLLLGETHRWRREGSGMRMGRGQVRTLLADHTGKVFRRMGEGCGRAATGHARGVADDEARSRKATEGICREVIPFARGSLGLTSPKRTRPASNPRAALSVSRALRPVREPRSGPAPKWPGPARAWRSHCPDVRVVPPR